MSRQNPKLPPLTINQLLKLDNVLKKRQPPDALQSLESSNSFTLSEVAGDFRIEDVIQEVYSRHGRKAWHINVKQKVMGGLPIEKFTAQKPDADTKAHSPTIPLPPPDPPEWSDLIYHPKVLPRIIRPRMRRKQGKTLHPHGYIWGTDVRQPFFPSGYPWQCIGRLDVFGNQWTVGTGALVGRNTVLTASHVVPWNEDGPMIRFTPAYFNGVSTLGSNVYSYVIDASSYDTRPPNQGLAPAFDFAVLRLKDRLGDILGYFGTKSYYDGWNDHDYWTLVGYPTALQGGMQPSLQGGISFHDDDEDSNDHGDAMELETQNGESTPGDSGGPYFAFWDDGPYIIGADVGGESEFIINPFAPWPFEDLNNVASAGPALNQLVGWARQNWG